MAAARVTVTPEQGTMHVTLAAPAFPGETFSLNVPEAIGPGDRTWWGAANAEKPRWEGPDARGAWRYALESPGLLSFVCELVPGEDDLGISLSLTNRSDRTWPSSLAFTCFGAGGAPTFRDHEMVRTWCRREGRFRRLVEEPRTVGPRPLIQLYYVEGNPVQGGVPFVDGFRCTNPLPADPLLAIAARREGSVTAIYEPGALFLFNNGEYSCIHSCPGFGALAPGGSAQRLSRAYFLPSGGLDALATRVRRDFPAPRGPAGA